jgi:hypothetical protein
MSEELETVKSLSKADTWRAKLVEQSDTRCWMALIWAELESGSDISLSCETVLDSGATRRRFRPALVPVDGESPLDACLTDTEGSTDAVSASLLLDPDVEETSALESSPLSCEAIRMASLSWERVDCLPTVAFPTTRRRGDSERLVIRWSISMRDSGRRYRGSLSSILWMVFCAEFLLLWVRKPWIMVWIRANVPRVEKPFLHDPDDILDRQSGIDIQAGELAAA